MVINGRNVEDIIFSDNLSRQRNVERVVCNDRVVWSRKPKQEEGLIFHLDVTNPACYSGSGSDIYDLTGNHEVRMESEPLFVNNSYFDCSNKQSPAIVIQTPDHYATDLYPKESGSLTICLYAGWDFLGANNQHLFETGYSIGEATKRGFVAEVRNGGCAFNITDDRGRGVWAISPTDGLLSNYAWSWIIFVYDKNNNIMRIYYNDEIGASASDTFLGAITGTQGKNFTLMSHMYSGCFAHFQKAKIYNRALSVAELEEMMANEG